MAHSRAMAFHQRKAYLSLAKTMAKNIIINEAMFPSSVIHEYKKKWNALDPNPDPIFFKLYSSLRDKVDINYVPDYLYRHPIESILNNRRFSVYYEHKCIYEKRLPEFKDLFPSSIIRRINGCYYDEDYNYITDVKKMLADLTESELVAKEALDTGAGQGVRLFKRNNQCDQYMDNNDCSLHSWLESNPDMIVQRRIEQNDLMKKVNATSINTFRVVTYRSVKHNETFVMQVLIKRGAEGSFVDNLNSGGNFIEILNDGSSAKYGITKHGEKIPFAGINISESVLNRIKQTAIMVAKKHPFHRQLFFDIFLDTKENAKIMEINLSAHPPIQAICGPAFGEFTDEVIALCRTSIGHIVRVIPH